ncbi:DUF3986 family protein [Fictibacillus fluitans]|uniref:DUF3986 family protein n=1 Tax=Fictibacillus fluitans TaxID=3058422 RepID=A0ABT8I288_9BACL|nr:DUF3986 family protein [Fictibacillus sp. NE201]MDN4527148.1 DUF3986 family protein [Fictibacillus sp. NE201]
MKPAYDSNQHLHLGYYENSKDIEATAYKRANEDIWDVYIDLEEQQIEVKEPLFNYVEKIGYKIFSLIGKELDDNTSSEAFEKWLLQKGII